MYPKIKSSRPGAERYFSNEWGCCLGFGGTGCALHDRRVGICRINFRKKSLTIQKDKIFETDSNLLADYITESCASTCESEKFGHLVDVQIISMNQFLGR